MVVIIFKGTVNSSVIELEKNNNNIGRWVIIMCNILF